MQDSSSSPLSAAVPRYTSYPTAPHFHAGVGEAQVNAWIGAVGPEERISLYVHVPFCDRLCWFCACHTRQTLRYAPVAAYLASLHDEIRMVAASLCGRGEVGALHFGGGSPTMLRPDDMRALARVVRSSFRFAAEASISVEIDPNDMDAERLDALADIGVTRASLGIQDFDPAVQRAINREQSFADTRDVVEGLRQRGVRSVNLDLLYGLPRQTAAGIADTVRLALGLRPDRLALFGYAHVPWFKKHQTMIDQASLPGPAERLVQSLLAAELITVAGYVPVGLDHFALSDDSLAVAAANARLRRNFQGYTDDQHDTLIGLGPSSVSRYREGYAQNIAATGAYAREVAAGRLPIARGVALCADDRARGWTIERLMCDFAFSNVELVDRFGEAGRAVLCDAAIIAGERDATLVLEGDRFVVPPAHRPLVRTIAARFDRYLREGSARHSAAV